MKHLSPYCYFIFCVVSVACCNNKNNSEVIPDVLSDYSDTSFFVATTSEKDSIQIQIAGEQIGIAEYKVFPQRDDLYPVFRIPSATITNQNTLLVSCENREKAEDRGKIDILIARKVHGVDCFEIRKVFEYNDVQGRSMNPVFLVNRNNGRIYLFVCHLKDIDKLARDHTSDEVDFVYKYSDDDGITWSKETSLKHLWDTTQYTAVIPSSVKGIWNNEMMLLPTMVIKDAEWYSGLLVNKNGKWHFSPHSPRKGDNECTIYVDNDKKYVLNCRTYEDTRRRYYYDVDNDRFLELTTPFTDLHVAISAEVVKEGNYYFMCFPDSNRGLPDNITLYASNNGSDWIKIYRMMNGFTFFGYSCIALSEDQMFTCYETDQAIFVQDVSNITSIIKKSINL